MSLKLTFAAIASLAGLGGGSVYLYENTKAQVFHSCQGNDVESKLLRANKYDISRNNLPHIAVTNANGLTSEYDYKGPSDRWNYIKATESFCKGESSPHVVKRKSKAVSL